MNTKIVVDKNFAPKFIKLLSELKLKFSHIDSDSSSLSVLNLTSLTKQNLEMLKVLFQREFELSYSLGYYNKNQIDAIFFDMDSTIIAEESIDELAKAMNCAEKVALLTEAAMLGELNFKESLIQRVALLEGMNIAEVDKVCLSLKYNPGLEEFLKKAQKARIPYFLISGGFMQMVNSAKSKFDFESVQANTLGQHDANTLNGKVEGEIVDTAFKKKWVEEICAKYNFNKENIVVIGDGANDLQMMDLTPNAIGYNPKPLLKSTISAQTYLGYDFVQELLF